MHGTMKGACAFGRVVTCVIGWQLAFAATQPAAAGAGELLRPVTQPALLAPQDARDVAAADTDIKRSRWVEVNASALADLPTTLRLSMFEDATFEFELERRESLPDGASAWFGTLRGIPRSSATLVLQDGVLAAAIRAGSRGTFDLRYVGDGRYCARELDVARLATCGGSPQQTLLAADVLPTPQSGGPGSTATNGAVAPAAPRAAASAGPSCDDGSVIDLLVVYTTAARVAAGGTAAIASQIDLAVADTNAAFTRSLINTQVNLVHIEEVSYAETGQWQVDGPRLVDPNDGYVDGVHPLRDEYGADCVSLWVNTLDVGGIGYFPDSSLEGVGASGFSMLRLDNAALLTLAHELGHNLWCTHDRPHTTDVPFADYSYGYVEPGGAWETIMAVAPPR